MLGTRQELSRAGAVVRAPQESELLFKLVLVRPEAASPKTNQTCTNRRTRASSLLTSRDDG